MHQQQGHSPVNLGGGNRTTTARGVRSASAAAGAANDGGATASPTPDKNAAAAVPAAAAASASGSDGCGSPASGIGGSGGNVDDVLRPSVDETAADVEIIRMMTKCWSEDPLDRPDFSALKVTIRKLNK